MANNSISQIIRQFLEMNQNSLENFEKISEAITTDKKTVSLDLFDEQGNLKTVQVPAFGYLKREIERLDLNFKALSGLSSGDTTIKLPDGTFRQINKSKLKTPAKSVTSIAAPREFVAKTNNFFESFLNPLLQVQLDVAGQVPSNTEKIKLRRYIIDSNDANSVEWFDDNLRGVDSLEVNQLISDLATNNISYIVDEEVIDAPVRSTQYNGSFDVSKVRTTQKNIVVDGITQVKTIKLYTLNSFRYNDAEKSMTETESLKVGDELLVNSGNASTKYRVVSLNTDTLEVELLLVEGYESVKIGTAQLKIYKNKEAYDALDIAIGFDERMIAFIKPVDPESNLEAEAWSPGTAFYTNDLVITRENGEVQTLATYYKNEVADFGQMIKALKDDSIPPATIGVQPDAPALDATNFKVTQVNTHLTKSDAFTKIKKLSSNKTVAEDNIKRLDDDLASRRALIATKKYTSAVEKDRDRNELNSLLNQRTAESKLYSSLVNEIKSVADTSSISNITPKYRVRGFWTIPAPKLSGETIPQQVVQFKVQYRYLSADGTPSNVDQIEVSTDSGSTTGSFSNWIEMTTKARQRVKDDVTGKYIWATESIEDGQAVNINQLDIPIQPGETVEFRVKSLSEAGWPANPIESNWSDITRIEFPAGSQASESLVSLIDSNSKEIAKVKLIDELESAGVYTHISDSFTAGDKYFAHSTTSIASGFLTAEQAPISLYDKLVEMQNEINRLRGEIENAVGELVVKLQKEDGSTEVINNNTVKQIFAGYYTDEVADLQIKKGHIVTKTFKILLENSKATPLELISRIAGERSTVAYNSSSNLNNGFGVAPSGTVATEVENDNYYRTIGKYDLAPTQYQNTSNLNLSLNYFNEAPYQSGQLRGQFVYSRYRNISNDTNLYTISNLDSGNNTGTMAYEYGLVDIRSYSGALVDNTNGFVWSGNWDATNSAWDAYDVSSVSNDYDTSIFMHIDHPALSTTSTYYDIDPQDDPTNPFSGNPLYVQAKSAKVNGVQTAYYYSGAPGLSRTVKMAFDPADQYLLGGNSCGSYLFLAPLSTEQLSVDADNTSGKRVVNTGEGNAIAIDVIFQYRMTDYAGKTEGALGNIGGLVANPVTNLTYSKKIGIDIQDAENNLFSFDLEVFAKYKP